MASIWVGHAVRDTRGGMAWCRVRTKGRAFWKSLHAATGRGICLLVLFLIFSGLPWATSWGAWIRSGAEMIDAGYPAVYRRYVAPAAPTVGTEFNDVPWTLQHAPMPPAATDSDPAHSHNLPHSAATPGAARDWTDAGLERAIAHIRAAGTADPLQVFLPSTQRGTLMVSTYPDQPQGQVTYHFDQQGALLVRAGFDDDGAVAQAIEMGVQLHMGNYVSRANQFVMLFACVGIVVLCASGMVMWCGGASRPAASTRPERATTRRIAGYSPWPPQPPSRSHCCSFHFLWSGRSTAGSGRDHRCSDRSTDTRRCLHRPIAGHSGSLAPNLLEQ
ncbi:hypothetical protein EYR01_07260 [Xanthomonas oryzae pv. oryzae]|nr:hypothetical protein EYR01_07260 [Xanthomonas oryzae pv. oryzae]